MLRMPLIDAAYCYTSRTLRGLCVRLRIGHTGGKTAELIEMPSGEKTRNYVLYMWRTYISATYSKYDRTIRAHRHNSAKPSRHEAKQRGGLYTVRRVDCPRSFDSMHVQWPERIRVEL